eukprot:763230-Hanusia_phi.AAC.1
MRVKPLSVKLGVCWRRRLTQQHFVEEALGRVSSPHEVEAGVGLAVLARLSRGDAITVVLLVHQVTVVLHQPRGVGEQHHVDVHEEDGEAAIQQVPHELHAAPDDPVEDFAHERALFGHARPLEQHVRLHLRVILVNPSAYLRVCEPDHILVALVCHYKHDNVALAVSLLVPVVPCRPPPLGLKLVARPKLKLLPPRHPPPFVALLCSAALTDCILLPLNEH